MGDKDLNKLQESVDHYKKCKAMLRNKIKSLKISDEEKIELLGLTSEIAELFGETSAIYISHFDKDFLKYTKMWFE